jgi:ribose transport system substrate-binding protein
MLGHCTPTHGRGVSILVKEKQVRLSRYLIAGIVSVGLVTVVGCSGGPQTVTDPSLKADGPLKIAYLPGPATIPYFAAQADAVKDAASAQNASVTVFDSGLDANKQISQLQSVVSSGQYDGVVIVPLSSAAIVPAVNSALRAGMAVGAADVPIGPDAAETDTQVSGVAVFAGRPFTTTGTRLGQMAKQACVGTDPCRVAFLYGSKAAAYDQALHTGFMDEIEGAPNISVVAEGEHQYSRAGGLTAMQNLVQAHRDLDVVVAVDQAAEGVEIALNNAKLDSVKILGFGGSQNAVESVRNGAWFGDVVQMPKTEGSAALDGVIAMLRTGKETGYVDPVVQGGGPADSIITKANAGSFTSQYNG